VHPAIAETFTYMSFDEVTSSAGSRTPPRAEAQGVETATSSLMVLCPRSRSDRHCRLFDAARSRGHRGTRSKPMLDGPPFDSIFYVGSIAKQFVAACVALARTARRVSHSSSPFLLRAGPAGVGANASTVDHLVHHTGGVKERSRFGTGCPDRRASRMGERGTPRAAPHRRGARLRAGISLWLLEQRLSPAWPRCGRSLGPRSLRTFARDRIFAPLGIARDLLPGIATRPLPTERPPGSTSRAPTGHVPRGAGALPRGGRGGLWTPSVKRPPRAGTRQLRRGTS
jgi:CubicO group peptidase (beta-lactamase class C family)